MDIQKATLILVLIISVSTSTEISDFAVEVVEYSGVFGSSPYDDPSAVLGKPATQCINNDPMTPGPTFRVKLVEAAYNRDLNQSKVITTIDPGEYIVVKFDHKVTDYPLNPYGQDLIVFGNSAIDMVGDQQASDSSNMTALLLTASGIFDEVQVSVSQDGQNWYSFDPNTGPWGDDLYPTQAYQWDRENAQWTDVEMDFTKPVDPNLTLADFDGISAADAIDLYDGSGGGTPFDLKDLPDYNDLTVDPDSGYRWIEYVRLEGGQGPLAIGGEVDAVSDVAVCGDPTHPYPQGDVNLDCRIDLRDFAALSFRWLMVDCGTCGGADLTDPPDQAVTIDDLIIVADNWLSCTYNCQ